MSSNPAIALLLFCLALNASDDLRVKPVPPLAHPLSSALTYHTIPIDLSDPRASEKVVPLKDFGIQGEPYYARKDGLNAPYYRCVCPSDAPLSARETVAKKLQAVNEELRPYGVELWVFDALRPIECQRQLWHHFLNAARNRLKTSDPEALRKYAGKYCSDPSGFSLKDQRTWPTHATGGAVDLTLRRIGTGELLYMGSIFDEASSTASTRMFESWNTASESSVDARRNRRLLYWAMTKQGFANYPNEWWHFDYGTQMWLQNLPAKSDVKKPTKAFYGLPVD